MEVETLDAHVEYTRDKRVASDAATLTTGRLERIGLQRGGVVLSPK
jgi:hypothetical protein